jgi:AAT family amino acid transporter
MHPEALSRGLKPRHVQFIALGGIIGSGYFLGNGIVIQKSGPSAFLAYILGGLIVQAVMFSLGELAVARPMAGSFLHFAKEFISPTWACGVGWSYWMTWVSYVPSEMIAGGFLMNLFFPFVSQFVWAFIFGIIITIINLFQVSSFGETEFWLAILKILAIILFCILAICTLIYENIFSSTNPFLISNIEWFPHGYTTLFFTMIIILVNFQGTELIGISAGESQNPENSIPIAVKNVTRRIIFLYVVPILLLVLIFPIEKITEESSPFADALLFHNYKWASGLFSFIVITAAISCSNSGLYGSSRALYTLALDGMAPKIFSKLSSNQIPVYSTLFSLLGVWVGLLVYYFVGSGIYQYLLALSGFSGAIAWISISWSQYNFRKELISKYSEHKLKYKAPFFPYITLFAIYSQLITLFLMLFDNELIWSLYIGLPILLLPMLFYRIHNNLNSKS